MPYIFLGLVAGALSGLVGIGGGIVIIPALVYIFGLSQQSAQGTTLALMVPPIGLLAAWEYYKNGHVEIKLALFIIVGFVVGSWLSAKVAMGIPAPMLKKIFAGFLLLTAIKMLLD